MCAHVGNRGGLDGGGGGQRGIYLFIILREDERGLWSLESNIVGVAVFQVQMQIGALHQVYR